MEEQQNSTQNQQNQEARREKIKTSKITLERSDQISSWLDCHVLRPSFDSESSQDTLFVQAPGNIKVFKFDHESKEFTFQKAIPINMSQVDKPPSGECSELMDYHQAGRIVKFTKSWRGYSIRTYSYKHNNRRPDEFEKKETLAEQFVFNRNSAPFILGKNNGHAVEALPHYSSHNNLLFHIPPIRIGSKSVLSTSTKA